MKPRRVQVQRRAVQFAVRFLRIWGQGKGWKKQLARLERAL